MRKLTLFSFASILILVLLTSCSSKKETPFNKSEVLRISPYEAKTDFSTPETEPDLAVQETESRDISIEIENTPPSRNYGEILGTWEADWAVGSFDGFHFTIKITDIDDTSIRASGNLHTPGIAYIQLADDRLFDGVFAYNINDNGEMKIIVDSFEWYATVNLTVMFDLNKAAYYYGFNTFSNGEGLNYDNRVML